MKSIPRQLSKSKLENKTVLVKVDFDIPIKDGVVLDDTKIRNSVPTILKLLQDNCKVILLSSFGNPKGQVEDSLSLMDVRFALGRILEKQVKFANISACENSIKFMDFGEVLLLENLKFSELETSKNQDDRLAYMSSLIKLADAYVFEAYASDVNVASVETLKSNLTTYIGLHVESEIENALTLTKKIKNPTLLVLGDDNHLESIELLENLNTNSENKVIVSGTLSLYFLKALNVETGDTVLDSKLLQKVSKALKNAQKNKVEVILPIDHVVYKTSDANKKPIEITTQQIPKGYTFADIGPKTLATIREIIEASNIVIWKGVAGDFMVDSFNKGTESIGEYIALSTPKDSYKVTFGYNITQAMSVLKIKPKRFNFISNSADIFMDFMQNKESDILTLLSKK